MGTSLLNLKECVEIFHEIRWYRGKFRPKLLNLGFFYNHYEKIKELIICKSSKNVTMVRLLNRK